jgi:DNA-binding response OmpR family regulator
MVAPYALVVEDDPDVAFIFQRALQDAGYQADVVATGHKAQARLVFTTPDLILLDMHLLRLSGRVVLRQIRGQRRLDGVRVIVATGETLTGEEYRGEADYVLVKPVGYEKVRELAESLLPLAI